MDRLQLEHLENILARNVLKTIEHELGWPGRLSFRSIDRYKKDRISFLGPHAGRWIDLRTDESHCRTQRPLTGRHMAYLLSR